MAGPIPNTWKEVVDDFSPSLASIEPDASHAVIVYDVPFADVVGTGAAFSIVLGYSYKDPLTGLLSRVLPLQHPYYYGMWATRIQQIQPHTPGTRDANGNVVAGTYLYPGLDGSTRYANYNFARITVLFEAVNFAVLSDPVIQAAPYNGDESYRYVSNDFDPSARFLTASQGEFKWAETSAGGPTIGKPCGTNIAITEIMADIVMTWHWVPQAGLYYFDPTTGTYTLPKNIMDGLGCVNSAPWHGYAAGTLLALPPKIKQRTYPVSYNAMPLVPQGTPQLMFDVSFRFKYFNPPIAVGNSTLGHNTAPYSGNRTYYKITAGDGSATIYQPYDFTKFFKLN